MTEPTPTVADADDALLRLASAVRATGYRFVTVTPATHQRVNARPGNAWARGLEDVFGWSRPFRPEVLPRGMFDLMRRAVVAVPHGEGGWRSSVRLSTLDGELFLHSAYPTTDPDAVFFGPDTYRFAAAVAAHLEARPLPVRRAVDVGCGAGPGAIVVAKARPSAAVLMVDINEAALRLARINAALAGAGNAAACRSDLLSGVAGGPLDLVIANPPYLVDPAERAYRHGGGPLGAGLSLKILDAALGRLAPGGTLLLYTGAAVVNGHDPFRAAAEERLAADLGVGWTYREMDPDVFGEELDAAAYAEADRIAAVVLTVTREGQQPHA
ncbi:MAG: HemK family modification methylase PA2179 [uncultured Acetobacteraceae bacterium]|uniref:HemK family modification methylase PA2179 n=1 Tax=uncultured Acetobacteraceae bacterium TaxID=169975 RepID=A0A6J4JPJ6_9PROT|nr:MAG: HemK family modification methylase PA2179 [uncultured Acetobacteraceae bacterium]